MSFEYKPLFVPIPWGDYSILISPFIQGSTVYNMKEEKTCIISEESYIQLVYRTKPFSEAIHIIKDYYTDKMMKRIESQFKESQWKIKN